MHVEAGTVRADDLTQQEGAAITQLWIEMAELMTRIRHRQRFGAIRDMIAAKDGNARGRVEAGLRKSKCIAQFMIENNQFRIRNGRGSGADIEVVAKIDVTIVERDLFQVLYLAWLYRR